MNCCETIYLVDSWTCAQTFDKPWATHNTNQVCGTGKQISRSDFGSTIWRFWPQFQAKFLTSAQSLTYYYLSVILPLRIKN